MDIVSKEILSQSGDKIKIIGLRIGELSVKMSAMISVKPGLMSTLLSFKDKEFCEWLPIWVWVIVHPEGTFLIDTGMSSDVNQEGYFDGLDFLSRYYFKTQMKFKIKKEEELDSMLEKVGLEINSINKVILTHLHIDHTGGLKYLQNIPILVNEEEWNTKDGAYPQLFPEDINIQTLKLDIKYEEFEKCQFITQCKDLVMIHTPGHTRGHCSIALIGNENIYLFGGDVAYNEKRLMEKTFSSTIKNLNDNQNSCDQIIEFFKKEKLIFLPTHDSGNVQRLESMEL